MLTCLTSWQECKHSTNFQHTGSSNPLHNAAHPTGKHARKCSPDLQDTCIMHMTPLSGRRQKAGPLLRTRDKCSLEYEVQQSVESLLYHDMGCPVETENQSMTVEEVPFLSHASAAALGMGCLCVGPPRWSRLKYVKIYYMYCHGMWYRYLLCPNDFSDP